MNAQFLVTVRRVLTSAAEIDVYESGQRVYRLTVPGNDTPRYLRSVVHQYRHSGRVSISH
jgi:hypothetical protein